ncbi:MAG: XRE family transcriptional regulator [Alphaproteobacteria bacterium]|nr:MAG: XRE family transcriptional regulator [Alphaproteobacteria bacterium]
MPEGSAESSFGAALRRWRRKRGFSQLLLAVTAGVSSRHVSFLETGRAKPSAEMIRVLADAITIPMEERPYLYRLAGLSAPMPTAPLQPEERAAVEAALMSLLHRHAPLPALALDRLWRLVAVNAPAERLLAPISLSVGDSLLAFVTDPVRSAVLDNRGEVVRHLARRVAAEVLQLGRDPALVAALAELEEALTDAPEGEPLPRAVVPTRLRLGDMRLSFWTVLAQLGGLEDLTVRDLKVELLFPADAATAALFGVTPPSQDAPLALAPAD